MHATRAMQLYAVTDDNRRAAVQCPQEASLHDVLSAACGTIAFLYGSPLQVERVRLAVAQPRVVSSLQQYHAVQVPDVAQLVFLPPVGSAAAFLEDQSVVFLLGCKPTVADELGVQKAMAKHMASFSSMLADIFSTGKVDQTCGWFASLVCFCMLCMLGCSFSLDS